MSIELPVVLRRLVDAGLWKSEDAHEDARIPRSVARRWDPEASGIHLEDPQPLASLASSSTFFREYGALDQIQVHSCFLIADFGIGSDSPIIVNVEHKGLPVSYLYWTVKGYKNGITEWRPITDLGSFVADIFPDGPSRPPFRRASSIEVNGARYYWRSSFGADDLTVLVQHVSGIVATS